MWAGRFGLIVATTCGLAGCSSVYIQKGDGSVEITRHFGIVSIELSPSTAAQLVEGRGIGLIRTSDGIVIGYHATSVLAMPETCRLVVWANSPDQIEALARLVPDFNSICVARKTGVQEERL